MIKTGDTIYWKNAEGEICNAVCLKIQTTTNNSEKLYYTWLSKNGGGLFVHESALLDNDSEEVIEYQTKQIESKINEFLKYIVDEDVRRALYDKLRKYDEFAAQTFNMFLIYNGKKIIKDIK